MPLPPSLQGRRECNSDCINTSAERVDPNHDEVDSGDGCNGCHPMQKASLKERHAWRVGEEKDGDDDIFPSSNVIFFARQRRYCTPSFGIRRNSSLSFLRRMTNGVRLQTKLRPRSARETAARACRHPSGVLSGPSFLDHSDFVFSAFGFGQRLNANFAVFVMKWAVPAPTNSLTLPLYSQCDAAHQGHLFFSPPRRYNTGEHLAKPKNV